MKKKLAQSACGFQKEIKNMFSPFWSDSNKISICAKQKHICGRSVLSRHKRLQRVRFSTDLSKTSSINEKLQKKKGRCGCLAKKKTFNKQIQWYDNIRKVHVVMLSYK